MKTEWIFYVEQRSRPITHDSVMARNMGGKLVKNVANGIDLIKHISLHRLEQVMKGLHHTHTNQILSEVESMQQI